MVICKYFLQGTCRFGNSCKFEHQLGNDHSYANASSILVQNYSNNKPVQATSNVDTSTLIKAVVNDMTSAEKGGQWLLSSYAPFRDKPAFPGFEDHSMEEVRYLFYESMKTGSIEQYKQTLQMMLQQAILKIKALQNPSPDAVNLLKTIYNTAPLSTLSANQTPFNPSGSSVFATAPQQKSVFGSSPTNQTQSIFAGSTNTNQVQQSVFGGNTVFNGGPNGNHIFPSHPPILPNKSIFGGPQQTAPSANSIFEQSPIFTSGAQSQSIFGNHPQSNAFNQNQPQIPFGQSNPQSPPQNPAFGQPQPNTQTQPQNTPFGQPNSQNQLQNSPFGQPNPQSPFAATVAPQQNVFQQQQNAKSPFTNQIATTPTANSQFGANNQMGVPQNISPFATANVQHATPQVSAGGTKPSFQHTQSIFGNLGLQTNSLMPNSVFGGTPESKPNEEFYSKLEDLTEEEIRWFQSDDLDISKIPEKPPTYEMCFKVQ